MLQNLPLVRSYNVLSIFFWSLAKTFVWRFHPCCLVHYTSMESDDLAVYRQDCADWCLNQNIYLSLTNIGVKANRIIHPESDSNLMTHPTFIGTTYLWRFSPGQRQGIENSFIYTDFFVKVYRGNL